MRSTAALIQKRDAVPDHARLRLARRTQPRQRQCDALVVGIERVEALHRNQCGSDQSSPADPSVNSGRLSQPITSFPDRVELGVNVDAR